MKILAGLLICASVLLAQIGGGGGAAGTPGGTSGQVQWNNNGSFGGFTFTGDCTLSIPTLTCFSGNPLIVARGGTGTASPALVAGTGISITGTWPNQTVNSTITSGCAPAGSDNVIQKKNGSACAPSSLTDDGTTVTTTEPIAAPSVSTGTSPPTVIAGTGGVPIAGKEGTAPSVGPAAGVDLCYADATTHKLLCSLNNGSYFPITQTIAAGATALGTSSISSGACATVVTATATGALSTDAVVIIPNASIKAVTGYAPSTSGGLSIVAFPSANLISVDVCNWSASPITPGAVTLNWAVLR